MRGLELGKTIALDNISTEKFDAISAAAKKQADFISGSIENLRLALQLTDDPTEVQAILNSIKTAYSCKHFDVLIQGLKDIEDSFDDPTVFRTGTWKDWNSVKRLLYGVLIPMSLLA